MKTVKEIVPDEVLARDPEALTRRVGSAYKAVFSSNATTEDVELVLIDLAQFTRYYDTAKITASPSVLAATAQRRAVMDRILDAIEQHGGTVVGLRAATMRDTEQVARDEDTEE